MLPARLSISQSGNIYGPPILGLRAILSDSAIQIPREELKDILERLPDGTDSILKAVVWQIDSNPFLNGPPQELIQLMESVAISEESEMRGDKEETVGYLTDAWMTWKSISKSGETQIEFFFDLKNIIKTTRAHYALAKERQEFKNNMNRCAPRFKQNLDEVKREIRGILDEGAGRGSPGENEREPSNEIPDRLGEVEHISLQRKRPSPRPEGEGDEKC